MAYKIYQKLQSGMANQGIMDAEDVDVTEGGTRKTLKQKLSTFAPLPDNVTDNKQKVMKNGQWVEVVVPSDASEISYNGDVSGATDVAGAINALAGDVADAIEASSAVQTAAGTEVGDVAQVEIQAGSIIWHDGHLYEVLALIAPGDHWEDMDVAPTTMSDQINALRGVSTEGVYLTVTPALAIPVEGVKARIYNVTSQTYLPEETITQNHNTVLLGQINYGDVYTIIMPEIEGYTKPADQTFKAGQMLRQRTGEYVSSQSNIEHLTIKASCSDSGAIGDYDVTVKVYDGQGGIASTYTLSIEGGTSPSLDIPYGSNYTVTFPDISGYLTPRTFNCTASASNRVLNAKYVLISGTAIQWVVKNDTTGEFEYYNTDYDMTGKSIYGMAVVDSTLLANNGAFILRTNSSVTTAKVWTNPRLDVPSAVDMYNGESNSVNVLQAISDYESAHNSTVQSLFKDTNNTATDITVGGIPVKYFVAAPHQAKYILANRTVINNLWA